MYRFLHKPSWQFIGWNAQYAYKEVWSSVWAKFTVIPWSFPRPTNILQNWFGWSFWCFGHILRDAVSASVHPVQCTVCIRRGIWRLRGWKHKGSCSIWWHSTPAFLKSQALIHCSPNVCSCTCIWSWYHDGYDEKGMKSQFFLKYIFFVTYETYKELSLSFVFI